MFKIKERTLIVCYIYKCLVTPKQYKQHKNICTPELFGNIDITSLGISYFTMNQKRQNDYNGQANI